ncbi:MAG: chemotaxis protein CheA [Burkholderiales bacterium]|nr:chemotaxis protein CheA [Burkholderiales bacterium]
MTTRSRSHDLSFVADALPTFISEAREQIESIEQLLLQLEEQPHDQELLGALFRCAHTVKGSAGIFGLTRVVEFTHHVETLLDQLRAGRLTLDLAISTLLLQCNDQIRVLIDQAGAPDAIDTPSQVEQRADLVTRLHSLIHGAAGADADKADAATLTAFATGSGTTLAEPGMSPASTAPGEGTARRWHVSALFGREVFRNGMDPLTLLAYLDTLGHVVATSCDRAAIPALDQIDPESCHFGFEIGLDTAATRQEIEASFDFVRDDCELHLIEPVAPFCRYAELIEQLPNHTRLGEMLVEVGAITRGQLDACLAEQAQARTSPSAADGGAPGKPPPLLGELLQAKAGVSPQAVSAAIGKQQKQREASLADDGRFIRVQADRLDAVINLLGELVIAGAGASMLARQTRQGSLIEANQTVTRLVEQIRNGTLQLRMVPIGETFARFRRVVRDTASQLGKEVVFEIVGGDTELDKSMVERIADPLMHLVRNGLDHGLETPAERLAAGKPAAGRLVLSARHESGGILIRIDDDGRGIDRQRVLQRAWERGLVEPGVVPADADILTLIFEPGFSTAAQVTELSGRGVGMDVVRRNIEALRGSVVVHSTFGTGTRIDIRLPLTLAIIDGFLVGVANSKFILPLEAVVEVISAGPPTSRPDDHGRYCVELRGEMLPVVDLRTLYELDAPAAEATSILVVQAGGPPFGLVVDALLGQHQTVIKPLGPIFRTLRGISGSSILGNGEVAMIFDVPSLGQLAEQPPAPRRSTSPLSPPAIHIPRTSGQSTGSTQGHVS